MCKLNMDRLPPILTTALQKVAHFNTFNESLVGNQEKKPPNPLSYPKSTDVYSSELFKNPTSEYRGCPFWAWNTKLNKDELMHQIGVFEEMGMGQYSNFILPNICSHSSFHDSSIKCFVQQTLTIVL